MYSTDNMTEREMQAGTPANSAIQLVFDELFPRGTSMVTDWTSPTGLRLTSPFPVEVRQDGPVTYAAVEGVAAIDWPATAQLAVLRLLTYAGHATARFLAADGSLVGLVTAYNTGGNLLQLHFNAEPGFVRAEISWVGNEGGLVDVTYALAPTLVAAAAISEETCAGIVFGETSVLSGNGSDGPTVLASARQMIAAVAYKRNGQGVARPVIPTAADLTNPNTKRIWERCQAAALAAKADDVKTCKHFVVWYSDDKGKTPSTSPKMDATWPYTEAAKITTSFGPLSSPISPLEISRFPANQLDDFVTTAGATNLYVMQYCGVP